MGKLKLVVPLIAQEKSNNCWHTAAEMIWRYWQQNGKGAGPMNTLANAYEVADSKGISRSDFAALASTVGLKQIPLPKSKLTAAELLGYLQQHGPLWAAAHWFGPGHVVVLTGIDIDAGKVYFNDPAGGVEKEQTIEWFVEHLASGGGGLMYKDPNAY